MELQSALPEIQKKGLGLAAISYDPPETLRAFAEKHRITYPLLSDTGSITIRQWGLLNTTVPETDKYFGYPHPGTFIVNRSNVVTARFIERSYGVRNTAASILTKLGTDTRGGSRVETAHLTLETSISDQIVTRGSRFSVVLDIKPRKGMHLYAPPQKDYKTVALTIPENANYRAYSIEFPRGEEFLFKPLNERVQVYRRPIRLLQDVMISITPETMTLARAGNWHVTVPATFEYQACDDRICYTPVSVPLSWTVKVKPNLMPEQ